MEPWMWLLFFITWPFVGAIAFRFVGHVEPEMKSDFVVFMVYLFTGWIMFLVVAFIVAVVFW